VQHFLDNAIFQATDVDFVVVANDPGSSITVPEYVTLLKRANVGFDFGAWSHAIFDNERYSKYDNFIFVNSSVMGPYMPGSKKRWTDIYIDGLTYDIKLFGSTINTIDCPRTKSHVQSYIFSMNRETLRFLMSYGIFSIVAHTKTMGETIVGREIMMSRLVIANGWNIGCLMKLYKGVDFRFTNGGPESYRIKFAGDMMRPEHFRSGFFSGYSEVVFVKGNRLNIP
jgi:hypothetical protein